MTQGSISIPILARVEGEGALELQIQNNQIVKLELRIFEPPRLFEKFLEGRGYEEVLDIVARICGICPVAYQMSAVHALENIFAIDPGTWVREMRRLFYCGEWLGSHSTHIHLLAIPDFFGFKSAYEMAKKYPEEIRRGLRLQALGSETIKLLGGRSVHPVGACVGGFFRAPTMQERDSLLKRFYEGLKDAEELLQWVAQIPFPNEEEDFTCVSLQHPAEYPINEGNIVSDTGLNIAIDNFNDYVQEYQVPYSNALHCTLEGKSYLVGPLARVNLNYHRLPKSLRDMIAKTGIQFPSKNMFYSIIARAIEICYGVLESIRILENYSYQSSPRIEKIIPRAGVGYGCTEAPRGILWHSYELDEQGLVTKARIVAPTGQNQVRIEENLRFSLQKYGLARSNDELRLHSEMIIRNYDPCISCSTHFLDLRVKRI
ncbi:MAG: Ni/Fe hydrogenase subunit alpha [Gammaproteobacteria bacterium]|nr:Ni/Fe hydrogenase subunit alpha [Gammaproteobacteria bacterium]